MHRAAAQALPARAAAGGGRGGFCPRTKAAARAGLRAGAADSFHAAQHGTVQLARRRQERPGCRGGNAGVVHEHVDATERVRRTLRERLELGAIRDVGGDHHRLAADPQHLGEYLLGVAHGLQGPRKYDMVESAVGKAGQTLFKIALDDVDAIGLLGKARKALEQVAHHDPQFSEFAEQLKNLGYQLNDLAAGLSGYLADLEGDSAGNLEMVQSRRALISNLCRKYSCTFEELLQLEKSGVTRLLELEAGSTTVEELAKSIADEFSRVEALAAEITDIRTAAAERLAEQVTLELETLAMPGSSLVVQVQPAEYGPYGKDSVAILLSSYAGADPRPLGKGASGGELSRIMLAIEVVLAKTESAPTFIFDEVDAGVGGAAAIEVGRRLSALANRAQVIVVTHLAQVAAFADTHLKVSKTSTDSYTASDVVALQGESRVSELARMLSGLSESESARQHAQELVELAKKS